MRPRMRLRGRLAQARRLPPDWPSKVFDAHIDMLIREDWEILRALAEY